MEGVLRPLGVGEMLDASIKIYRSRWKPMIIATFLVTAPAMVLVALVQLSAGDPASLTKTDPVTNLPTLDAGALWTFLAALGVTFVITLLANNLATAGVLRMVGGAYLGEEVTWRASLAYAFRRFWSLTWILVLTTVAFLGGLLACVVPVFWFQGIWAVALPVLLMEDVRGVRSLGRSNQLVKGRFWPVLGTILLGGLMASVVQGVLAAPVLALTFVKANFVLTAVLQGVVNVAATALTTPFVAVLTMVIYFDLRIRKEGFDLLLLAERVGVEPPEGGFPAGPGVPVATPWAPPPGGWAPPPQGWAPPPQGWGPPPGPPAGPAPGSDVPSWPPPEGWVPPVGWEPPEPPRATDHR